MRIQKGGIPRVVSPTPPTRKRKAQEQPIAVGASGFPVFPPQGEMGYLFQSPPQSPTLPMREETHVEKVNV
jgi:hypothetical protein